MKNLLLPIFLCWLLPAKAQQDYMIYNPQGKVYVKKGTQKRTVKTGEMLNLHTRLFIGANASVTVICNNYTYFTLHQKGDFLLSSFVDSCVNDKPGFSKAYFSYLWNQFSNPAQSPEKLRRKYMQNTGAVVRGCPDVWTDSRFDTLLFTETDTGYLKWNTTLSQNRLSLVLFDTMEEGSLLYEKRMPGGGINIDSIRKWLKTGRALYWNIAIDGEEKCSRKYLLQVPHEAFSAIEQQSSLAIPANTSPAEKAFAKGFILEYNQFLYKAMQYYQQAHLLEPTNSLYKVTAATLD